jgi:hypothetical protein
MDEDDRHWCAWSQPRLFASSLIEPGNGTGGVVTYLFKEDLGGPMGSPYRKDAVKRIEEKCAAGYIVLEEGEVQGYSSMSTVGGAEGEVSGRRWGIKFRCK